MMPSTSEVPSVLICICRKLKDIFFMASDTRLPPNWSILS